jgi:hypothetical protein
MEELQTRLLRETPPWRKMQMLAELNQSARRLALAGLHQRYPSAGESELRRHLANLLLGQDLTRKVYGEHDTLLPSWNTITWAERFLNDYGGRYYAF